MIYTIAQITDQYISKLPEGSEFYQIKNLSQYGFPSFLLKRIEIELKQRALQEISFPESPWFDSHADKVQQSWQSFLNAAYEELHLPAEAAEDIISTSVGDVVTILIQPRKEIPNLLFGNQEIINQQELNEREQLITVYRHFAQVLMGYMERKNRTNLNKVKCNEIIAKVDKKLTGSYSPQQWAQLLEPLFELSGKQVDAKLFQLFFEDKKMPRSAQKFDSIDGSITKAEFTKIFSSPEFLNEKENEADKSELSSKQKELKKSERFSLPTPVVDFDEAEEQKSYNFQKKPLPETQKKVDAASVKSKEKEEFLDKKESTQIPDKQNEIISDRGTDAPSEETDHSPEQTSSVNSKFSEVKKSDSKEHSLNELFVEQENENAQNSVDKTADLKASSKQSSKVDKKDKINREHESSDSTHQEEAAIWQRFINSAETEEKDRENPRSFKDRTNQNPDISDHKKPVKPKGILEEKLGERKAYFREEIFNGSETWYKDSIKNIANQDNWEEASKLIKEDIFKMSSVNIYSQTAVDFIDRLQTYFDEKENLKDKTIDGSQR